MNTKPQTAANQIAALSKSKVSTETPDTSVGPFDDWLHSFEEGDKRRLKNLIHAADNAQQVLLLVLREFGADVMTSLCEKLLAGGAPGLHFYTLNRADATLAIGGRDDRPHRQTNRQPRLLRRRPHDPLLRDRVEDPCRGKRRSTRSCRESGRRRALRSESAGVGQGAAEWGEQVQHPHPPSPQPPPRAAPGAAQGADSRARA